jgi:hypothetical protein
MISASLRARQPSSYRALVFPFEATEVAVAVCSWFANLNFIAQKPPDAFLTAMV